MKRTGRLCWGLLRCDLGRDEPAGDTPEGTACHRRECEVDRDGGESSGCGRSPSGKGHTSNGGRRQGAEGGESTVVRRGVLLGSQPTPSLSPGNLQKCRFWAQTWRVRTWRG